MSVVLPGSQDTEVTEEDLALPGAYDIPAKPVPDTASSLDDEDLGLPGLAANEDEPPEEDAQVTEEDFDLPGLYGKPDPFNLNPALSGKREMPEVLKRADALQLTPEQVRDQGVDVDLATTDYSRLLEASPSTRKVAIKNPGLLREDVEQMSYVERLVRHAANRFDHGMLVLHRGQLGWELMSALENGEPLDDIEVRLRSVEEQFQKQDFQIPVKTPIPGFDIDPVGYVAESLPVQGYVFYERLKWGLGGIATGAAVGAGAGAILARGPGVIPGALSGARAFGRAAQEVGTIYGTAVVEGGNAFIDFGAPDMVDENGQPMDVQTRVGLATLVGAVNGVLELAGLEQLVDVTKLTGLNRFSKEAIKKALRSRTARREMIDIGRKIGGVVLTEGVTEAIQDLVTAFAGYVGTGGNNFNTSPEQIIHSFSAGAQGASGPTIALTMPSAITQITRAHVANRAARQTAETLRKAVEEAAKSKTVNEAPNAAAEIIRDAAEDNEHGNVYIEPNELDVLMQQNELDPEDFLREAFGEKTAEKYLESKNNGGNEAISVPLDEYIDAIVGTEIGPQFSRIAKVHPDEDSVLEQERKVAEEAKRLGITDEKTTAIIETLQKRFTDVGYEKTSASTYAEVTAALINRMAIGTGQKPETLLKRYGINVARYERTPEGRFRLVTQEEAAAEGQATLERPPVREDGRVELVHWGSAPPREDITLDPKYHGKGRGKKGGELDRKNRYPDLYLDRTYYGIGVGQPGGYERERGLGRNRFTTSIEADKLYDLRDDPEGLKKDLPTLEGERLVELERRVKEAGYSGYWVKTSRGLTAAVFDPLPVESVEVDPERLYQDGEQDGLSGQQTSGSAETGGLRDSGRVSGGEGVLDNESRPNTLPNAPGPVNVVGRGRIQFGIYQPAVEAARRVADRLGLPRMRQRSWVKLDREFAQRIADAYDKMKHDPHDPLVAAAYRQMIEETKVQYEEMLATGLTVEFIDYDTTGDPYAANPRLAILDVIENNHLYVFSTRDGFGTDEFDSRDNPMLEESEFEISGQVALNNDLFRAVHDFYGHIKYGAGFRAEGEENAFQSHATMYSPLARIAMAAETRGQNLWVNFGPFGDHNRNASAADTHYADNKIGKMPDFAINERLNIEPDPGDIESDTIAEDVLREIGPDQTLQQQDPDLHTEPEKPLTARVSELGFYSAIEKAFIEMNIRGWDTTPIRGDQIVAKLKKHPGVKEDEIRWTGIEAMAEPIVNGKPAKFTREQAIEFIRSVAVNVTEVMGTRTPSDLESEIVSEPFSLSQPPSWMQQDTADQIADLDYLHDIDLFNFWVKFKTVKQAVENGSLAKEDLWDEVQDRMDVTELVDEDDFNHIADPDEKNAAMEAAAGEKLIEIIEWADQDGITIDPEVDYDFADPEFRALEAMVMGVDMTRSSASFVGVQLPLVDEGAVEREFFERFVEVEVFYHPEARDSVTWVWRDKTRDNVIYQGDIVRGEPPSQGTPSAYGRWRPEKILVDKLLEENLVPSWQNATLAYWSRYIHPGQPQMYWEQRILLPDGLMSDVFETPDVHKFPEENIIVFLRATLRQAPEPGVQPWDLSGREMIFIDELQSDLANDRTFAVPRGTTIQEFEARGRRAERRRGDARAAIHRMLDSDELRQKIINSRFLAEQPLGSPSAGELGLMNATDQKTILLDMIGQAVRGDDIAVQSLREAVPEINDEINELVEAQKEVDQTQAPVWGGKRIVPDSPFRNKGYVRLGLARAILTAIAQGHRFVGWPTASAMTARWGDDFTHQYDRLMPKLFKQLTGVSPTRDTSVDPTGQIWYAEIPAEVIDRLKKEGLPLFQQHKGKPRGFMTPLTAPDNATRQINIGILPDANLSTVIHELGHGAIEMMLDQYRQLPRVDPEPETDNPVEHERWRWRKQLREDVQTLVEFAGLNSPHELSFSGPDPAKAREAHEKLARAFEAYTMEGKAPSIALRRAFARMRAWMIAIYKKITNLNVELKPEVRDVFDRMLATDEQIEDAKRENELVELFTDQIDAGMTDREWANYQQLIEDAHRESVEKLQRRAMDATNREVKSWWRDEFNRRLELRIEKLRNEPNRIAYEETLGESGIKLDRKEVVRRYGTDVAKRLTRSLRGRDTMPLEMAAETLSTLPGVSYRNADEMIQGLLEGRRPIKEVAAEQVRAEMLAEYGDVLNDGSIADVAVEGVIESKRAEIIRAELRALHKKMREVKPFLDAERKDREQAQREGIEMLRSVPSTRVFTQIAKGRVGAMQIKDIRPSLFLRAARKASREAKDAIAKQDWTRAAIEKQRELLNIEMYRIGRDARDRIDRDLNYLKRFSRRSVIARLTKTGALAQIEAILDRFNLSTMSGPKLERREKLVAWIRRQEASGVPLELPAHVLNEAYRVPYQELQLDEFIGVVDSVKHIDRYSRLKARLLKSRDQRDFAEIMSDIVRRIATSKAKGMRQRRMDPKSKSAFVRWLSKVWAEHRKIASYVRAMDHFEDGGLLWESLVENLHVAASREAVMRAEASERMAEILKPVSAKLAAFLIPGASRLGIPGIDTGVAKKEYWPQLETAEFDGVLTLGNKIMIALNMGNAGNKQRLLDGYGWTEAQVQEVLNTLTREQWEMVEQIWRYLDSFWPEIKALAERIDGVAPEKVEGIPVQTPFGEVIGGYFPIAYSRENTFGPIGRRVDPEADVARDILSGRMFRAQTKDGHRKERARQVTDARIDLNMGVIFDHLNNVIHDLTHHEALVDAYRIVKHPDFERTVRHHYGDAVYEEFSRYLTDVAIGDRPAQTAVESAWLWLRTGVTIGAMGLNLITAAIQVTGITQSIVRVGAPWVAKGVLKSFSGNPAKIIRSVHEKSDFMRMRSRTMQRELNEIANTIEGKSNLVGAYFYLIMAVQTMVDVPTWLGAYEKALSEGREESAAIHLADQAVRDSQGGGQVVDLPGVQRMGPAGKLWTAFYTYFAAMLQLTVESFQQHGNIKDSPKLVVDMLLLYTVPAALTVIIRDALRSEDAGGDDDDDSLLLKIMREQVSMMMGTLVGVRELSGAIEGFEYRGPAALRLFGSAAELIRQLQQGEMDAGLLRAMNRVIATGLHLPATAIERTAEALVEYAEGRSKDPRLLATGTRSK